MAAARGPSYRAAGRGGPLAFAALGGFRPKGQVASPSAAGPRRGPRTDGLREDRWIHRPNLTPEGRAFEYNDDDDE